jgi:signal transduction histidine kinase
MARNGDETSIGFLCRPDGTILKVFYDRLGLGDRLTASQPFGGILAEGSDRKAGKFLRVLQVNHVALDWHLDVVLPQGVAPLLFFGYQTEQGTVVIASDKSPSPEILVRELTALADRIPTAAREALARTIAQKRSRATVERSLYNHLARLNDDLVNRQRELVKKNVEMETLSREKAELLGVAAHDLRNPISGILTASEYLLEDAACLLAPEHITLLQSIESSTHFMLQLIDEMLEISTLEWGNLRLNRQPADLAGVTRQNLALNRLLAERKGVQVDLTVDGTLPAIQMDVVKMTNAISSLVRSAIKFSQPGSRIEIRLGPQTDRAIVAVRYRGGGITPNQLRETFGPVQKGDASDTPSKGPGAGLGLTIARRIVEGHGGRIWTESDAEGASILTIALPAPAETGVRKQPGRVEPRRTARRSVASLRQHGG